MKRIKQINFIIEENGRLVSVIFKWIKIMNLGIKAPQKPEIKILDCKTDPQGNTLYQIQFTKNYEVTWKPLTELKEYYQQVRQFERDYQNRDADWSQLFKSKPKENPFANNHSIESYLKTLKNRHKKMNNQPAQIKQPAMAQKLNNEPNLATTFDRGQEKQIEEILVEKKQKQKEVDRSSENGKKILQTHTHSMKKEMKLWSSEQDRDKQNMEYNLTDKIQIRYENFTESSLTKYSGENMLCQQNFQCSCQFLVNGKVLLVSFDGERIWGQNLQNSDKYNEHLNQVAFEVVYKREKSGDSGPTASGFILYHLQRKQKIIFQCFQKIPLLDEWLEIFRNYPVPEIGFKTYYTLERSPQMRGKCQKIYRNMDKKAFCGKIILVKNPTQHNQIKGWIRIMKRFKHPNVLEIDRYFLQQESVIIISEWISQTLKDYIPETNASNKLSEQEFKNVIFSLFQVISKMNDKKYGHFSLQKQHILMRENKTPVLTGFSKSRQSDFALCSSISPLGLDEQKNFQRNEEYLETDTIFLGAILFEYYTADLCFERASVDYDQENGNIQKQLEKSEKLKGNNRMKNLIRKMLNSDPAIRGSINKLIVLLYVRQLFQEGQTTKGENKKQQASNGNRIGVAGQKFDVQITLPNNIEAIESGTNHHDEVDSKELNEAQYAAQYLQNFDQRMKRKKIPPNRQRVGPLIKNKKRNPRLVLQHGEQMSALKILQVYQQNRDWWARIITNRESEEHVLRDALKMNQPLLLLSYYEELLEEKRI